MLYPSRREILNTMSWHNALKGKKRDYYVGEIITRDEAMGICSYDEAHGIQVSNPFLLDDYLDNYYDANNDDDFTVTIEAEIK